MAVSIFLGSNENMYEFIWNENGERKVALIIAKTLEIAEEQLKETYGIATYDEVALR